MRTVSQFQLRAALPPMPPVIIADVAYALPTLAWLQGPFWEWFQKTRWEMGLTKWTRRNDCDNFARAYAQAAADCHALTLGDEATEGLAVGEFYYHAPAGPHAIVAALTDGPGLTFLEPQNGQQLKLTEREITSCFFARF